ncbi:hypothetical protein, partial [Picosynechococcus sp. NKBG042902]|uniref:hypothetical protein n=1 Tax=Picosynechococcus sp. NKBG042902 TaxID=490193 RepID=UPI0004AB968A
MITPGALIYKLKTKFGHGLDTAYYRDLFRKKILDTAPITRTDSKLAEVHTLTSSKDCLNTIWSLKSFYVFSEENYALCIHDDGTLNDQDKLEILKHFPNARLIERTMADREIYQKLQSYPSALKMRENNPFSLKVFDFTYFSNTDKILFIDSDILFFAKPTDLIERINNSNYKLNTFNKDWNYGYSPDIEKIAKYINFELIPYINTGLGLIHKISMSFEKLEHFLSIPGIQDHPYGGRAEQTLIALCSSEYGFEFLSSDYDVNIEKITPTDSPCRHYVSPIRYLMYKEGLKRLEQRKFL